METETPEKKPEPQPREHAVRCRKCFRRETWNHDAICEVCRGKN